MFNFMVDECSIYFLFYLSQSVKSDDELTARNMMNRQLPGHFIEFLFWTCRGRLLLIRQMILVFKFRVVKDLASLFTFVSMNVIVVFM